MRAEGVRRGRRGDVVGGCSAAAASQRTVEATDPRSPVSSVEHFHLDGFIWP